ncbi:hypothetical protein BH10BAC2_BH10BAC2_45540 [soil metagenome]
MKKTKGLMAIAISMLLFGACKKEIQTNDVASLQAGSSDELQAAGAGHVFILSNQVSGNEVLTYSRAADGTLSYGAAYATGGTGTGGGLGNQGSVIISQDKQYLLAVNPGSNSISSLKITNSGLKLLSTVSSGGTQPVSISQHDGLVYVLNSGGDGNISGFWFNSSGTLSPITNSTKPLSAIAAGAAQISFVEEGKVVAITEKATNTITTYTIKNNGTPGVMHTLASSNPTPFGFAVGRNNIIYVSEAVGGAIGASTLSSYYIAENGTIRLVTGPVGAYQSAACWVVLTNDGKYAYTTNTASNNLSAFKLTAAGNIKVAAGIAALSGLGPIDADIDGASKFLYVLNSVSHNISAYTIAADGILANLQTTEGLPVGATGLAAE